MALSNTPFRLFIFLTLIVIGILSYDHSDFENNQEPKHLTPARLKVRRPSFDKKNIPKQILTLNTQATFSNNQADIKENIFGKFLNNRAEFYTIKRPTNKIYSAKIHSISLVYLDGNLYKTKYNLVSNITSTLIKTYGKFNIRGFDFDNRLLIDSLNEHLNNNASFIINQRLDNYELYWQAANMEILYRANSSSNPPVFELTKRRTDYEVMFSVLEISH